MDGIRRSLEEIELAALCTDLYRQSDDGRGCKGPYHHLVRPDSYAKTWAFAGRLQGRNSPQTSRSICLSCSAVEIVKQSAIRRYTNLFMRLPKPVRAVLPFTEVGYAVHMTIENLQPAHISSTEIHQTQRTCFPSPWTAHHGARRRVSPPNDHAHVQGALGRWLRLPGPRTPRRAVLYGACCAAA
ncbi:hypothetical protein BD413DRAFT_283310 [Trametes elegans]|nr:hypothetical protein BD413DRAFT_283310 [Trametes elegans]